MKTEAAKSKKFPRAVKVLFWLAGVLVVYTVLGFFAAPAVIKAVMLKRLPADLKRPVAIAGVKVNPYALSLSVRGLAVNEKNGAPFAGFDEFYARLKFSSFFRHGWAVEEIYLTHPFAQVLRGKDGKLNLDDIVAALNQPSPAPSAKSANSTLPLVMIDSLHIDNADVSLEDLAPPTPVKSKLLPVHLHLDHLSTDPKARNPYTFTAKSDAGETFQGDGKFSLEPLQVSGDFQITALDLKKYSPYLAPFALADITDGKLDVAAHYEASLSTNGPDVSLTNGTVQVSSLSVKSSNPSETVLTVSSLSVKLVQASLGKKLLHLALVKTSGGSLLARQNPDGTINLLSLLKQPANSPAAPPAADSQTPWKVMVDEIAMDRYNVALEDKKPAKPAKFNLNEITFNARNFSTVSNPPLAVDVSMGLNEAGHLSAKGVVHLQPPSADLAVDLAGLDLRPLQPYVEQRVKLAVGGGLFSVRGNASYNSEKGAPMAAFHGDLSLSNFTTTDLIQFKDFVKLEALEVNGIQFTFQPNQLDVQEVKLSGLSTSILMQTNHQINLLAVLPQSAATSNAPPPAAGLDFPVTLASLVIDKASFHFSDQSIEPNCLFDVQEFGGTIKGLSSREDARAAVDMRGKVDDVSTFSVTGDVNPLSKDLAVNLAIDCKNVNLTPFTPYMEKYAGYPLQRGKLMMDLHHNIAHGRLDASNHVVMASLTLGAKNNSPDATTLPVKLGVALLKDRNGNIDLDVPLHGNLSDPKFRVMPLVWQVLDNLLEKAATAPFTLLGKLFGGGGEEMSFVDFQPGLAGIPPAEQAKLDKLSKALYERPGLQVEISAGADPASDTPALARLKLDGQIRSLQARELIDAGTPPETVQSMQVDPTNYTRLLKMLYLQTIGASNPPAPVLATNPPATPSTVSTASTPSLPSTVSRVSTPSTPSTQASAALNRPDLFVKGDERMMRGSPTTTTNIPRAPALQPIPWSSSGKPSVATAAPSPKPAATASTNTVAAEVPAPAVEPTQDQMEASLLATMQISLDDLRELMQARARSVQAALVKSGQVEGGRLFILAPQPISLTAKGQPRANLSLQ
jgi:hypothetical protein